MFGQKTYLRKWKVEELEVEHWFKCCVQPHPLNYFGHFLTLERISHYIICLGHLTDGFTTQVQ